MFPKRKTKYKYVFPPSVVGLMATQFCFPRWDTWHHLTFDNKVIGLSRKRGGYPFMPESDEVVIKGFANLGTAYDYIIDQKIRRRFDKEEQEWYEKWHGKYLTWASAHAKYLHDNPNIQLYRVDSEEHEQELRNWVLYNTMKTTVWDLDHETNFYYAIEQMGEGDNDDGCYNNYVAVHHNCMTEALMMKLAWR